MTPATAVGIVILAAAASPYLLLAPRLVRAVFEYRRVCREWADLTATVTQARADFEDVRAAERETLIERIAREETPGLVVEVEAYLSEVTG